MNKKPGTSKDAADKLVKNIRRPRSAYLGKANRRVHAMEIRRIGLDLAKYVFEVHAVGHDE